MESELASYETALQQAEAEKEELDGLIEILKRKIARLSGIASTTIVTGNGRSIPDDAFFGQTIAEAAKKYLAMVKQVKTTPEIHEALVAGGLKHSSTDFNKTLRSIMGANEEFLRVNDKWGLTSWYPGAKRSKKGKQEAAESAAKQTKQAKQTKKSRPIKSNSDRVLEFLGKSPDRLFSVESIAEGINSKNIKSLRSLLSQMVGDRLIEKGVPTGYKANRALKAEAS